MVRVSWESSAIATLFELFSWPILSSRGCYLFGRQFATGKYQAFPNALGLARIGNDPKLICVGQRRVAEGD